jgi:hypothetical protein
MRWFPLFCLLILVGVVMASYDRDARPFMMPPDSQK